VQGCAFSSATSLVCSTDDPSRYLYGVARQLLTVTLAHPVDGRSVTAVPTLLGEVPAQQVCPAAEQAPAGEVEGIDIYAERMTVAVNSPCSSVTQLFTYTRRAAVRADPDPPTVWLPVVAQLPSDPAERTVMRFSAPLADDGIMAPAG
jgi:hypothetical protein